MQLKVGPQHHEVLARIASALRRRSEQTIPSFSTQQIIATCYPGTIVTGRTLPRGVRELVCVDKDAFRSHRAPHVIMYNRALPVAEQRLSISHALAHIIFDGGRAQCSVTQRSSDREQRCDRFAAELLVPLDELRPYVGAWPSRNPERHEEYLDQCDQIASQFNVPPRVIDTRIRELALSA